MQMSRFDIQNKFDSVPKPSRLKPVNKKKRHDKSDLGESFIAPDGGWGWLVAFAAGMSYLVTMPIIQQFGILFRDRFKEIGISSAEMTTLTNTLQAVAAFRGLFNGPLFRRFSYRQCAIAAALLVFIGLLGTALADSFIMYLLTYSFIYGIGKGLMASSSSLAVNTYFKIKRRDATAYQYTIAGLGPIGLPYLSTFLMTEYKVAGAVLIYSGISFHNLACALIYQPVKWHVKKTNEYPEGGEKSSVIELDNHQSLDHPADTDTPMMTRANNGCYGSKDSFNQMGKRNSSIGTVISYKISDGTPAHEAHENVSNDDQQQKKLSIFQRISNFFDLDLLRDFTFINLVVGSNITTFVESNFSILTPFILSDFEFNNNQIATAMSVLAAFDLAIRFLIPIITAKIKLDNKYLFFAGIFGMCLGRTVVAHSRNFTVVLIAFGWMGMFKAMSMVFRNLIIPGYVPLNKLPAASGLELLLSGVFTLGCGPLVGLVREATNYTFTIHWLNAMCFMVGIAWILEDFCRKKKKIGEVQLAEDDK